MSNEILLITGINGFVGRGLAAALQGGDNIVKGTVRSADRNRELVEADIQVFVTGKIDKRTDWTDALDRIDVVIHAAARTHSMNNSTSDPLMEFRKVNTAGTLTLARQAAAAGVKRFIFISSIKVNGEVTGDGKHRDVFSESDIPCPCSAYAISKWEAEQGLLAIAEKTGMEVVIIRPPLIYGHGVKANFRLLIKLVRIGIPLPFGAVHNMRSFVALDNLVNFIIHSVNHPNAAGEVFLISDGEDISTTELLQKIARALGKRSFLLPVPVGFMTFVTDLLGKKNVADRLFGSLQADISKARDLLGWKPIVSMDESIGL